MGGFTWENLFPFMQFLLYFFGALCLLGLFIVLLKTIKLVQSATTTLDETEKTVAELRTSVVPILDKADVSVDALNAQLIRLDNIMAGVEQTQKKVSHTADAASNIVQTPVDLVSGFTDKLRRGWRERRAEAEDRASAAPRAESSSAEAAQASAGTQSTPTPAVAVDELKQASAATQAAAEAAPAAQQAAPPIPEAAPAQSAPAAQADQVAQQFVPQPPAQAIPQQAPMQQPPQGQVTIPGQAPQVPQAGQAPQQPYGQNPQQYR
jgi:uncharacterized protein YoxC